MSSLEKNFERLESDLVSDVSKISAYHDLPFAAFQYDPREEFEFRKRLRLLCFSLEQNHQRHVMCVSLARLVWRIIEETEGLENIAKIEQLRGFDGAQATVNQLISSPDFRPIEDELAAEIQRFDPARDIVFLVRAAVFAPAIFRCSALLEAMHKKTMVPMILFYPGALEGGTNLRFMNMAEIDSGHSPTYRVKIYGEES
jgi:hypothetical protein